MAVRTFGWVQEAYIIENLKKVVEVFVAGSKVNKELRSKTIPRLISKENGRDVFIRELAKSENGIPYVHLKGKGTPKGYTRGTAPCSGIIQAALPGQRKEYQSDWPADSYLRWAVSVGFLNYDREKDRCSISEEGRRFAESVRGSVQETDVLTKAFMSYPPVCRILHLLSNGEHMTKFEIGAQLGFIGEAGFTSIPQHMVIRGLKEAESDEERRILLQDTEGTSDKYVRTICSWLKQMRWVEQASKEVAVRSGGREYKEVLGQAYQLTLRGRNVLKYASGTSKFPRVPKRVMWDMLATKAPDKDYLRNRRTYMIQYIQGDYRTVQEIIEFLSTKGILELEETILDDLRSFINIGLNVQKKGSSYRITDEIIGLEIPKGKAGGAITKSNITLFKEEVRKRLNHVDHHYLILMDLGFDGKSNRDYEIQTAELLTAELKFKGARLGNARKPDVCVFYGTNGLIIDNKAYAAGYSLPIKQADEMCRYLEENVTRDKNINPNKWWEIFDSRVEKFRYAFVSGRFTGGFKDRLENIQRRTKVNGGAVSSRNLLLLAEEIKSGRLSYEDSFRLFDYNEEILF